MPDSRDEPMGSGPTAAGDILIGFVLGVLFASFVAAFLYALHR